MSFPFQIVSVTAERFTSFAFHFSVLKKKQALYMSVLIALSYGL